MKKLTKNWELRTGNRQLKNNCQNVKIYYGHMDFRDEKTNQKLGTENQEPTTKNYVPKRKKILQPQGPHPPAPSPEREGVNNCQNVKIFYGYKAYRKSPS